MFPFIKALEFCTTLPKAYTRKAGFDYETTGSNLHHGDMPFMLSFTYSDGVQELWEAPVNPHNRMPLWNDEQLLEISERFSHKDWLYVGSNTKFDVRCTELLLCSPQAIRLGISFDPVEFLCSCHDTIQEHHAVHNAEDHKLKSASVKHLGIPDDDERVLKQAANESRHIAKALGWKIANKTNCPAQRRAPSSKDGGWAVMDMWLPKTVAKHQWEHSVAYAFLQKEYKSALSYFDPEEHFSDPFTFAEWCEGLVKKFPETIISAAKLQGWEWHPPEVINSKKNPAHSWWTLAGTYCNRDTFRSLACHNRFESTLVQDGLLDNYLENRTCLPVSYETEQFGITINIDTANELITRFERDRRNAELALKGSINVIGFNPGSSKQVQNILYGYFGLPVTRHTKSSIAKNRKDPRKKLNPSTDSDFVASVIVMAKKELEAEGDSVADLAPPLYAEGVEPYPAYKKRLDSWYKLLVEKEKPSSRQLFGFSTSLLMFKRANTGITYLNGYLASSKPVVPTWLQCHVAGSDDSSQFFDDTHIVSAEVEAQLAELRFKRQSNPLGNNYAILNPSLNPVGTKSVRYSSSNPNGQNISKGGKGKKGLEWLFKTNHSLRSVFGPTPDREWWAIDYHQIQLIIFALLCGDKKMVEAVYRGEDFHEFVAKSIFGLSDAQWKELPDKRRSAPAGYNGYVKDECRDIAKTINFAFVFGAQEDKLNRTSGIPGCYNILRSVFPKAIDFLERTEWQVCNKGYVNTPGGYRLFVPEESPFAGVNYIAQGGEAEIMKRAQYAIWAYLRRSIRNRSDMFMTMYVHDEIVFDAKRGFGYQHIGNILSIMNDAALSFGFPVKAEPKLILTNWAEAKSLVTTAA